MILICHSSTIYFHNPKKVRADEWMFAEMESPWSGDGRGVVMQRIFSKDGTLLATCHQEVKLLTLSRVYFPTDFQSQGVVRLKQDKASRSKL